MGYEQKQEDRDYMKAAIGNYLAYQKRQANGSAGSTNSAILANSSSYGQVLKELRETVDRLEETYGGQSVQKNTLHYRQWQNIVSATMKGYSEKASYSDVRKAIDKMTEAFGDDKLLTKADELSLAKTRNADCVNF